MLFFLVIFIALLSVKNCPIIIIFETIVWSFESSDKIVILRLLTFFMFYYDITTITISMYTALNSIFFFYRYIVSNNSFFPFSYQAGKGQDQEAGAFKPKFRYTYGLGL